MTAIGWTDVTWNPVVGCTRVSAGCRSCYASALHNMRYRKNVEASAVQEGHGRKNPHIARVTGRSVLPFPAQYDEPFAKVRCLPERLDIPLRWRKPKRIFVNSMSDLFHADVSDEFIDQVFATMALAPQHTFQVLTKRPERMQRYMTERRIISDSFSRKWGPSMMRKTPCDDVYLIVRETIPDAPLLWPLPNVWLGISAENQETFDERWPYLRDTPAAVRFVSFEPLLGPIDLERLNYKTQQYLSVTNLGSGERRVTNLGENSYSEDGPGIDWAIIGAESGKKRRQMNIFWMFTLAKQFQDGNVPVFIKQDNAFRPGQQGRIPDDLWVLKQFPE